MLVTPDQVLPQFKNIFLFPKSPRNSSRQRRQEDQERFKTHTITKNDIISGDSSPCPSSPASTERKATSRGVAKLIARQKAISLAAAQQANSTDDSDSSTTSSPRRTTLKQRREEEADRFKTQVIKSPSNILEEEAKAVVEAIAVSKSTARSRSASADGMLDSRILGKI